MRLLPAVVFACALVGTASASDFDIGPENLLVHFRGPTDSSDAGLYLQPLGDINGDGFDDIAISCLESTATLNSLGAFILFGGAPVDNIPDMLIRGDIVAEPVDFTGDGIPDLVTRERYRVESRTRAKMLFFRGYADSLGSEPFDSICPGESSDQFAEQFCTGLVDSDSFGDIVALHRSYPGGEAILYYRSPISTDTVVDWVYQIQDFSHYFVDLSVLDFNADGFLDIAAGLIAYKDPDSLNSLSVFYGPDFGPQPDLSILASTSVDTLNPLQFASFSTDVGDIDADGVSDICVVHQDVPIIYFGETQPLTRAPLILNTRYVQQHLPHPVSNVGDINNDGYSDLALSTTEYTWQGSVEFYLGGQGVDGDADDVLSPLDLPPVAVEDNGRTIAAAGDVNGDGIDDFMFSAGSISFFDYGDVFVYSGDSGSVTAVEDTDTPDALPVDFDLKQNYPNPFNARTTIQFNLKASSVVTLSIFNPLGRHVTRLLDGCLLPPGKHEIAWDVSSCSGMTVASGTYLYKLSVGGRSLVRKMILLK